MKIPLSAYLICNADCKIESNGESNLGELFSVKEFGYE